MTRLYTFAHRRPNAFRLLMKLTWGKRELVLLPAPLSSLLMHGITQFNSESLIRGEEETCLGSKKVQERSG